LLSFIVRGHAAVFGDLLPDRLRRSNGSYVISFAPVSGDGDIKAPPRHIRRKISDRLKPVDNFCSDL
jgi:hypothetical protein